jgi:hypothetical protein
MRDLTDRLLGRPAVGVLCEDSVPLARNSKHDFDTQLWPLHLVNCVKGMCQSVT